MCRSCAQMTSDWRTVLFKSWTHRLCQFFLLFAVIGAVSCQTQGLPPTTCSQPPLGGSPVNEGGSKVLICQCNGDPVPQYRWLKDGRYITNASYSGYRYAMENISKANAGSYRCEARNDYGAILSSSAHVEVAYMGKFAGMGTIESMSVNQGGYLYIPLPNLESFPFPTITWQENQIPMVAEYLTHQILLNRSLVLLDRDPASGNSKSYEVEAINGYTGGLTRGPVYQVSVSAVAGLPQRLVPTLVIAPRSMTVNEDISKVEFECVFNARPVADVQIDWYRVQSVGSRILIVESDKYLISLYHRTLTIKSPQPTDNGVYQCEGTLAGFSDAVMGTANLTVNVGPTFVSQFPSELTRDFGQELTMNCESRGVPQPVVHWYFNALELFKDYNSSSYTLQANHSLTISQLDQEHAGVYQCFLRNAVGEVSKYTRLKVNASPPEMITPPTDLTVVERAQARLTCETKGAPKPVVTWTKATSSGVVNVVVTDMIRIVDTGELYFLSALTKDSGVYTCLASNSKGNVSASATLRVYVKTEIIRPPQNKQVVQGGTAEFECGVSHDTNIQVTWEWRFRSRQTNEEHRITNDMFRTISDDGTLTIKSCGSSDIGDYTCLVTSDGGNDNRTVSLAVIQLPGPPVIQSVQLHPTDVRGVVVAWTPTYDGNTPILSFSIQYLETISEAGATGDSTWVTYSSNIPATNRSTVVTGLKPARFYQFKVRATNKVGEGSAGVQKPDVPIEMPQQPPSAPPKSFFGVPATNRSVWLGWQPPDESARNGPLLGYTIKYKPADYPNQSLQQINVTNGTNLLVNPRYELFGLDFNTEYQIQIAAFNIKGIGVFSDFIRVWTKEGRPTEAPRSLLATTVNSTTIRLTWLPPSPQFINGVNLGYKVFGKRSSAINYEFEVQVINDQTNPTGLQSTYLINLLKYTVYSVTVLCYTIQGDGPAAPPITQRTAEDVPSQVGSLNFMNIRDTSLKVNWTEPTQLNGIITGYTLMYEEKNRTGTRQVIPVRADVNSYTIFNLMSMTWYTVYVAAATQIGTGPWRSADIKSGVPPELPTAPSRPWYSNIEARTVLLQFVPGYDGQTSITLWIVEALEGTSTEAKTIFTISAPSETSFRVQNLKPYTYYQLRVIAENIVGQSDPSEWSRRFQTQQDVPAMPPGSVTVRALNSTALRVSWTPLSIDDWNGVPLGYKLYYKLENATTFNVTVLENGMNMDSVILSKLEEWMVYEVKMLSYNDAGNSTFSPVTRERTRESVPSKGPENVKAVAVTSTSINVTWGEVPWLEQNGMIQGFKVKYYSHEAGIQMQDIDVPGNTSQMTLITDLQKYVEYNISVLAYTRMGDGVPSYPPALVRTLADVPGPPVKVWFPEVTYDSATIEWAAPDEPNGIITGYMVSYKVNGTSEVFNNSTVLSPDILSYKVSGLKRQEYYMFHVRARTHFDQHHNGWGAIAAEVVYTMINRSAPNSPEKPSIIQSQVKARSITISWVKAPFNGYGPLRNFTVQYKRNGHQWTDVPNAIMPTVNLYSVKGLRPATVYVFRIAATNDVGMSPFSVQSDEQKTLEDFPEGPPQNVQVERLTRTSVRVTWEQPIPTTWNGVLLWYKISYRQTDNNAYSEQIVPYNEPRSRTFTDLDKFVNYEFLVNAYNSIGPGPTSTPITVFVGEAAPTAPPRNIVAVAANSSEIRVSWLPPPLDTQNGNLSGYKITYWLSSASPETASRTIVRETSMLLTGLRIYTEYLIAVQAYNLAGEGPKSDVVTARTMEGLPGPPVKMSFWNVTYISLDVQWNEPVTPNGRIISYTLAYKEESLDGGTKVVTFHVAGNETRKIIEDLVPGSSYMFSVSARTSVGVGSMAEGNVTTGPQPGSPGRPRNLIMQKDLKDQKVILTWQNDDPGNTPIYTHFIQADNSDSTKGWETILQVFGEEARAEISLLILKPDSDYKLRVMSMNYNGVSPYSDPSEFFKTAAPAVEEEETPFHYKPWFLVIVALVGVIVVLIVVSLLCLVTRRSADKHKKAGPATSTTNLTPTPEPEDGGFGNFEMTRQSTNSRRNKYAGIRNGNANSIYARPPPRPSPASVAYSDDDGASAAKPPLPDDDDDDDSVSSCTDKPSHIDSSNASEDSESIASSIEPPLPPPPASPPPPPFSAIGSSYSHDPMPSNSWHQNQNNSSFNAYQYTDSEAESSHYAYSLNGGQILLNNTAGSRAPLPGFSSFV